MDSWLDFTLDPVNFPEANMTALTSYLHNAGQRYVPIVDPGIMVREHYDAYEKLVTG